VREGCASRRGGFRQRIGLIAFMDKRLEDSGGRGAGETGIGEEGEKMGGKFLAPEKEGRVTKGEQIGTRGNTIKGGGLEGIIVVFLRLTRFHFLSGLGHPVWRPYQFLGIKIPSRRGAGGLKGGGSP